MIISLKKGASGSSRGLIHYLAHSKLDREKEGIEKREFFSETEYDLDVRNANRHLSIENSKPKPEELLHIVIAPSKEEIQSVGNDLKTRKDALKAVVRETVARLKKEVKAKKLKWVAALHFNTDNPHAHLAVQKEFLHENGRTEHLRINRQMLHYNEVSDGGEKKLHKGALILAAENKIEEIAQTRRREQEKTRDSESEKVVKEKAVQKANFQTENSKQFSSKQKPPISNFNERRILAEEMLALSEIRRRTRNIENLIEHGDKKRFKIKDEQTGNTRHVSLYDIERKIEIVSRRKSRLAQPNNSEKRLEAAAKIAQEEREKSDPVTEQLETIRLHILGFKNRHLSEAQEKHTRLCNQKLLIEKKYERLKIVATLPLFDADEIQQLQNEAVREQNSEKTLLLESIRQSNAAEMNRPSRRDEDVRGLLAAQIVRELKVQAAEKRLLAFSASKDFTKVKIGDSVWSHRELEQHELQTARKNDLWSQVKSKTSKILFRADEKNPVAEKLDYPALHQAVSGALENLETVRRDEIKRQKEFNQTLDKIFEKDTNPNKTKLTPAFSAFALSEAEDFAVDAGREKFYENSLLLQDSWLREKLAEKISKASVAHDSPEAADKKPQKNLSPAVKTTDQTHSETESQTKTEQIVGGYVLGRAEARLIIAQTNAFEAQENLAKYARGKLFIKHRITDAKTGAERELSLRDVEPRKHYYLLDSILERALETKQQKELRRDVLQAANNTETELTQKLNEVNNRQSRLENQKEMLREKYSALPETPPIFTPKEIAALAARAERTLDKSEAERLEKISNEAEKKNNVGRIHNFLEDAAKNLEILVPNLTQNFESKISRPNNVLHRQQTTGESRESYSQSATSDIGLRANHKNAKTETIEIEKTLVKEKGRTR